MSPAGIWLLSELKVVGLGRFVSVGLRYIRAGLNCLPGKQYRPTESQTGLVLFRYKVELRHWRLTQFGAFMT